MDDADLRADGESRRVSRLGIAAAIVLLLAYALPEHFSFHGVWISLLLGPVGGGFTFPLQQRIFIPLRPIGVIAVLLFASIARGDRSMKLLRAGVLIGVGLEEALVFITLLGEALVASLTAWLGLVGAVMAVIAGITTWKGRVQPSAP